MRRTVISGTYELPVGHGKPTLGNLSEWRDKLAAV
jgi:hypothetical protein